MKGWWLTGAAALLWTATAAAAPITGELSINGSSTIVSASSSAFDLTFQNPGNIGGTTGSFESAFGVVPPQITGVVSMIASLTNTSSNFELYSATVGGINSTLQAADITGFTFTPPSGGNPLEGLDIVGAGTLTLTGANACGGAACDPTPGFYTLTTQGLSGVEVTFSSTQVATGVSEPSSLGLLGVALIGMFWGWQRWRPAASL